jgi:hypothetical protein
VEQELATLPEHLSSPPVFSGVHVMIKSKKSLKIPKGKSESYIEKEQTTQWPKEQGQKNKQRYIKHTQKAKDRVT